MEGKSSIFKGVHWEASRSKWKAGIMKDGQRIFLGRFESEVEAARKYDKAAYDLFGEFAYLNFPDE